MNTEILTAVCFRPQCGREFEKTLPTKKFCSKDCRVKFNISNWSKTDKGRKSRSLAKEKFLSTEKGKESKRDTFRRWVTANRDAVNKKRVEYHNRRYKSDPHYRLLFSLRSRLRAAFKAAGALGSSRSLTLTGCTLEELKEYLQSRFKPGMSWSNFSGRSSDCWVIDHIRPCCQFDLSDVEQQKACFHFSNLQPLWWAENMEKEAEDLKGRDSRG